MTDEHGSPSIEEEVDSPGRRTFMASVIGAASAAYAAGIGYVIYQYMSTGIEVVDQSSLKEVKVDGADALVNNSAKLFKYGSKPGIIIKNDAGEYHAFTAVCTHLGCTVSYQPDKKRIFCACHGGIYDPNTGKNISGPPPAPLAPFKVLAQKDGIFVEKA
jgi:cytochrome b6-f complex iron-sulfur subunit